MHFKRLSAIIFIISAALSYAQVPGGFIRIDGGSFTIGSPVNELGRNSNEAQRQVNLSPFYLAKYEVTQADYEALTGTNPSYFKGANLPVEKVSWFDAIEYCNKLSEKERLTPAYIIDKGQNPNDPSRWKVTWNRNANGYRLPTEAEWEYACRGGTTSQFNTGNTITSDEANFDGTRPYNNNPKSSYRQKTIPVGSLAPNSLGLFDMHGNVGEWCWDWNAVYANGELSDPEGAETGSYRVFRGGGWNSSGQFLRSACRSGNAPSSKGDFLGFRLARNQ